MNQEFIEQNIRILLGDLLLQTIMLKARIAELEAAAGETVTRPNGKAQDAEVRQ
jgi:hypothetical protein